MKKNFKTRGRITFSFSKILLLTFSLLFGIQNSTFAQSGAITISGTVKDVKGEALIGAAVRIKNTTKGLMTNFDGKFTLKVPSKKTVLLITYAGMKSQEITVGNKRVFNIILEEDSKLLNEVVVTAMGIKRKAKSLTYATQKMDNKDLMRVQDANFINSLQGKAAGLSIKPNAGGAGGASKIVLRGNKSVLGNNTPLIVVDGIPMSNPVKNQVGIGGGGSMGYGMTTEGSDALSSINPDDIQSVNILKGANAAALYGSAASNGVLMITTKKGRAGKLSINYSTNATMETPLLLPEFQNTYGGNVNVATGMMEADSWGKKMSKQTAAELGIDRLHLRTKGRNDAEDFFQIGTTFNNSVSVSGGTEKIKSYFSYGNTTANGMIENNTFNRHALSFRQNYLLFNKILSLDLSFNYVNQRTKNRPGGGSNQNPIYHLYVAPRNADMEYYKNNYMIKNGKWTSNKQSGNRFVEIKDASGSVIYKYEDIPVEFTGPKQDWVFSSAPHNNPYWITNMIDRKELSHRLYGYISANVKITEDLSIQGRYSIDKNSSDKTDEISATTQFPSKMVDRGVYRQWLTKSDEFYLDGMINYNKEVKDFSINVNTGATAHKITSNGQGMSENATVYDYSLLSVTKVVNSFDPRAGSGSTRSFWKSIDWDQGLFITGQLSYKDALFLESSYRRDWYRAFTQFKNRDVPDNYGYFSVGANGLIHEFFDLPEFISSLKVRTSYSEVGNSIPNVLYTASSVNRVTGSVNPSPYANFENPIPEKMKSFEIGYDISFFNNSLNWDLTFYNGTMHNNYLNIGSGAGLIKPVNTGVIRNRGIETTLNYATHITRNLIWKTGFNFSFNDNTILQTYKEDGLEYPIGQGVGQGGKFQLRYKEGGRYGDLYATDFQRDADGKLKLGIDGKPHPDYNHPYEKYVGNMNAKYRIGWNNNFNFKNFNLYFLIDGKLGGKVVSFTEASLDALGLSKRTGDARLEAEKSGLTVEADVETPQLGNAPAMTLPDGQVVSIQSYYETIGNEVSSDHYVYDATNFRVREVSLGYTFKNVFGPSKNLSLSLIGRNLLFLYKKAPIDPDTSLSTQNGFSGFDFFNMPSTRSFGIAATLKF